MDQLGDSAIGQNLSIKDATMVDPRIKRTHAHVFSVIQQMVETRNGLPVTMNDLAATAEVSRRTLNLYWSSIEEVLADAMMAQGFVELFQDSDSTESRIRIFLRSVRDSFQQPLIFTGTLALASTTKFKQDPSADEKLFVITRAWMRYFRSQVGQISEQQYASLVGPIVFQEMLTPTPASDELIESLVQLGLIFLIHSPAHSSH